MNRSNALIQIRPIINSEQLEQISEEESFQNRVLRPIMKLQNDYLCFVFTNDSHVRKQNFAAKDVDQKKAMIRQHLKTNQRLKNQLVSAVTSLMTMDELQLFYRHQHEFQKRILTMATERLIDQRSDRLK